MIYTDGVHLVTDAHDITELHDFACRLGLSRRYLHNGDHYDLTTADKAQRAVDAGAILIAVRDLTYLVLRRRMQRAGNAPEAGDPPQLLADWKPARLDPKRTTDKHVSLMRRFRAKVRATRQAGGRRAEYR